MDNIELKLNTNSEVVRIGEAKKISYPVKLVQAGITFESLFEFVKTQLEAEFIQKPKIVAIIDYKQGSIKVQTDYRSEYSDEITAELIFGNELKRFKINSKESFSQKDFCDLIKFDRRFIDQPTWQELFTKTKNISLEQVKSITNNIKDNKANYKQSIEVTNKIDYPDTIILDIPIFKNDENKQKIEIDLNLDVIDNQIKIFLKSPNLEEIYELEKDRILKEFTEKYRNIGVVCLVI